MTEFQEAIERVIAGPERRSRLITRRGKEIVAYHEAGHAVVMQLLPNPDPVHKITIVAAGMALRLHHALPDEDHLLYSTHKFKDELAALLGGRVAEEDGLRRHHHRRQQRPGAGHQAGADDGHAVRHERRAGPADASASRRR